MARRLSVGVPPSNSYPHPPFPDAVLRAVVSAIRRAWMPIAEDERKRGTKKAERRDELELNDDLRKELFALLVSRKLAAFTSDVFETPVVDGAVEDYSGKRIQSRPDITIRLRDIRPLAANPLFDAIFIECKRVREGSNLGPYFTKGMKRFLDGQYAWAVPQAVMIGYLETGQVLPDHLEERVRRNGAGVAMQLVAYGNNQAVKSSGKRYLAYTRHERTWKHRNDDGPGDIELLHLWLSRFD